MATKTKKRSAADRYASQVNAESTLRFGQEESTLAQALKETDQQYQGDVSVAKGTRAAIQQAAKTAKPQLQKDFGTSNDMVKEVGTKLAADLAKLPAAGEVGAAAIRDGAGTQRRLAESLAMANAETTARSRDAVSGERYAIASSRQRRSQNREKITDRATALANEKGAFAQGRTGELVENSRERSITRRGQDVQERTARADRRTANRNADEDRKVEREKIEADEKGKNKPKTADNHENARTLIAQARHEAQRLRTEGKADPGRAGVADTLLRGRPDQSVEDPESGTKIKIPGVEKSKSETFASVALDLEYDGHISTANMKKLQKMGYSVKDLGLETAGRSGTKKPQSIVPKPRKSKKSKPNALSGTTLGGFPAKP